MKITKKWLKKYKACCSETDMDRAEKELKGDINLICNTLLKENRFDDANWILTKAMTKKQRVQYYANRVAIYATAHAAIFAAIYTTADAVIYAAKTAAYTNATVYATADAVMKTKIIKNGLKILKGV